MTPVPLKRSIVLLSFVAVSTAAASVVALKCRPFDTEQAKLQVESVTVDGESIGLAGYEFDRVKLTTDSPSYGVRGVTFTAEDFQSDLSLISRLEKVSEEQ